MVEENKQKFRLLLTGGGTGGHLFPAIATAEEFQRQFPATDVLFVGTSRKVDSGSLKACGYQSKTLTCYGVKGKSLPQLLKALITLPVAYYQALGIIKDFKPDVLLGVGGYVTGPVVAAGQRLGVPTLIHEQNSVPGLANRKLGGLVDKVCLSLPGSEEQFDGKKVVFTGNPVRKDILELAEKKPVRNTGRICLLVLGGSQGARTINKMVPKAFRLMSAAERDLFEVIHQTGDLDAEEVRQQYVANGVAAEVEPFFNQMHAIYSRADLLVSRAGATTLSEVAVLGKAAILIPYPYAADNHQEKNGQYYVDGGGAMQFREEILSGSLLKSNLLELANDSKRREEMSVAMKKLAFPDAHKRIVATCVQEIENRKKNV